MPPVQASFHNLDLFDAAVYRNCNQDLNTKTDDECRAHFDAHGKFERRAFARVASTHDRMSMRWLRGSGIEIGAGSEPIALFGHAERCFADVDRDLKFGGASIDYAFNLDDPVLFDHVPQAAFDFAVASHVLEHVDSFLLGLRNLIGLVKPGAIVYAAVPSCEFDFDGTWMPNFDFQHHVEELSEPLKYARVHDDLLVEVYRRGWVAGAGRELDAFRDEQFYTALLDEGRLLPTQRFPHHKHSYSFAGWTQIIMQSLAFLGKARLVDSSFGYERMDCNFVFERAT